MLVIVLLVLENEHVTFKEHYLRITRSHLGVTSYILWGTLCNDKVWGTAPGSDERKKPGDTEQLKKISVLN
jgi:hypothetical protein